MSELEQASLDLVRQVIEKYCDVAPEAVMPEASLADLNVDSLSLAEMLFALEDRLGTPMVEPSQRPQTVADLQRFVEPFMASLAGRADSP